MDEKILTRYNTADEVARYDKKFEKHWTERINNKREQKLVDRLLDEVPAGRTALDAPCGTSRLFPLVRRRFERVVEGDWSFHMVQKARENIAARGNGQGAAGYVRLTALAMPFRDRAFDLVLSVRLSHHIRDAAERLRHLTEIMRISRGAVVFTYFAHESVKARMRRAMRKLGSKKREKWTLKTEEVAAAARENGFRLVKSVPLSRLFSGHRYALLVRDEGKAS